MTFEEPGLEERSKGEKQKYLASLHARHWAECFTYDASLAPTTIQA